MRTWRYLQEARMPGESSVTSTKVYIVKGSISINKGVSFKDAIVFYYTAESD